MARDSKLDQLSRMWLFSECSKAELAKIGRVADEITVPPASVLCEEGRPGFEFFFILQGRAAIRRRGRKVASLGAGQYFGELSLLDRRPRSATVVSETTMSLLVLGQREFNSVMADMPRLAHKLLMAMAGRLRAADAKLYN
ncbi:MAG TPA: cyclic nucleotide-binding domain-containing protein [Acidimicrobiales bacterium]|nr:cyclic nucleotide-binding domain-containing protein [Acidimicrobiales bacterium]